MFCLEYFIHCTQQVKEVKTKSNKTSLSFDKLSLDTKNSIKAGVSTIAECPELIMSSLRWPATPYVIGLEEADIPI